MANQPKKYKKFVATAATATLVASAIVPVASAASFSDTAGNTHEAAISALAEAGVISGYPDGTFKPNKELTRSDVVKLLGKFLVTQGYEIPSDAVSSPRFSDLTSKSNKELLEYAAVVADAGVFAGSNGKLLAGDPITRENMAIVLVRMVNTLNDVSLEEYVASQKFDREVKDLNAAKAEARTAIDVLDFYDITTATNFLPKNTVTRGQFATFVNNVIKADFSGASATTGTVKAINATTVEVTFGEDVADVKALDFAIKGLEVSNAVAKQTDKKTVVLTTSPQTAGVEYTVTVNGNEVGKFTGISAVIPTAVKMLTPSVQGTIGKEATVKAQVEVPAGQSKAGIPVTFNIVNGTVNQLNEKIEVVAYTNEEGIASHSYTRYYKYDDNVTAYASQKSSVFASAKVYWAQALTVTEVTSGNTLANGSKKVYKIKTDTSVTETFGTAATSDDYNYVNVAFLENVDVAPDKLVRGVSVIDTGLTTNASYPSQVTTGGVQVVRVKVNAAGEGTFTLTGSNGTVTPVVFVDESTKQVGKYTVTALQSAAPAVKFELNHTLGLTVKAEGVQNAAAINRANANNKGTGIGGRDYTVTITDKDGKVAPAGTKAYVTFQEGNYSTDKAVYILDGDNYVAANKNTRYEISVTGTKGEATFTLVGNHDGYATPTVYLENGKEFGLDKADLQVVGEGTYFVDAVINNASLKVLNSDKKEVKTLPSSQTAYFEYSSVDQNGFDYYAGTGSYEVSYQVTAQFADVTAGGKLVKAGTTETVKINAVNGKATLVVTSENVASNVSVQASASLVSLPNQTATIEFTKGTQIPAVYTGLVSTINTVSNKLTFTGYDAITYSTASFKNQAGVVISESAFETTVSDALAAKQPVKVTAYKNADGTYTLEIEDIGTAPVAGTGAVQTASLSADGTDLTITFDKNIDVAKTTAVFGDFTFTGGGTATAIESVTDNKVVLSVSSVVAGTSTLNVAADKVVFTDGTSNAAVSAKAIVQPVVSKVVALTQTTQSLLAKTANAATGDVTVGTNKITATVPTSITGGLVGNYNDIKVEFVQNPTVGAAVAATYNAVTKTITVSVSTSNATIAAINTAIQGLTDFTGVTFDNIALTESASPATGIAFADLTASKVLTLTGGVSTQAATPGVYAFTLLNNLDTGDSITINGNTYVAGTDFTVASTLTTTASNLVAAIKAKDARFDAAGTDRAASGSTEVITLTEATATGLAAPAFSYSVK